MICNPTYFCVSMSVIADKEAVDCKKTKSRPEAASNRTNRPFVRFMVQAHGMIIGGTHKG